MAKLAIDIVLLPPEEVMDKAIDINRKLVDDPTKLDKKTCLPHASLCIGVINTEDLQKLKDAVSEIAANSKELALTITLNEARECFEFEKSEALQELHEQVIQKASPHLTYDATLDMCYSPPPVVEKTLHWINNYKSKYSGANFWPHITLAANTLPPQPVTPPYYIHC